MTFSKLIQHYKTVATSILAIQLTIGTTRLREREEEEKEEEEEEEEEKKETIRAVIALASITFMNIIQQPSCAKVQV